MGKSLIITEKPSVAQEFAKVLNVSGRKDGYIENQNYVITWCVGHLVGLVYPESYDIKYKKWRLEDLPFLPKEYKYDVIKDVSRQYDVVHGMLMREDIDRVYWAGDAGKEGQTIEENIRNFGGVRDGMEELRVWIDSQTEEEIQRGIREAKPMSAYENLGKSGIMRTIEDYAMGINFSRVMSVKYGGLLNNAAGTRSYTAIAVGRVMTCVLGMVVIREREIRNFKETPFYRVVGNFTDAHVQGEWKAVEGSGYFASPLLYKENGFREKKDALALIDRVQGHSAIVESMEKNISRKRAPLLFNLAELQAECAKRFKISPDETLQVAQDLYERKLTTYPRTDARVLSTPVAKEIHKNISPLRGYEPTSDFVEQILDRKLYGNIAGTQYTDDAKVTDHYAIIPTGQGMGALRGLSEIAANVYEIICRRFLSIFYPAAEYQKLAMTLAKQDEFLFANFKYMLKEGYLKVATNRFARKKDDTKYSPEFIETIGHLKKGDILSLDKFEIKEGETSPPKRYNSGTLILTMENAGQFIEDEELREQIKGAGIGTSATRDGIITKLVNNKYIALNKKTQIVTPTFLGEIIYDVVYYSINGLLRADLTASWEKGLCGVADGSITKEEYTDKMNTFVIKYTNLVKGISNQNQITTVFDRTRVYYKK